MSHCAGFMGVISRKSDILSVTDVVSEAPRRAGTGPASGGAQEADRRECRGDGAGGAAPVRAAGTGPGDSPVKKILT